MILILVVMMEVAAVSSATNGSQFTRRPVVCLAKLCYTIGLSLLVQYGCLLIAIEQDTHILPSPVVPCNNNDNNIHKLFYFNFHNNNNFLSQWSVSVQTVGEKSCCCIYYRLP